MKSCEGARIRQLAGEVKPDYVYTEKLSLGKTGPDYRKDSDVLIRKLV
jgi:hypothetical protein